MAAPLIQVEEQDATGEIAALYDDFRATMRSSFVPTVIRALAAHPGYLVPAWTALRPNLEAMEAEQLAGRLRVACVERLKELVGPARSPGVSRANARRAEIRSVLETFFYVIPKTLVAVTALREAWEGRPIGGGARAGQERKIPRGAPAAMPAISLLPLEPDDPRLRRIFDAAARAVGQPTVPSLYRALGRWPDYLEAVWESALDARVLARYRAAGPGLVADLARGCHALPFAFAFDRAVAGRALSPDGLAAVDAILTGYQRTMPEVLLQIARFLRDL